MCVKANVGYMLCHASILTSFLYLQGCGDNNGDDRLIGEPAFAFSLTDLNETAAEGLSPPEDPWCFYEVPKAHTRTFRGESDYVSYSWIPHSKIPSEKKHVAPSGAFVYKLKDGSLIYKAIQLVPYGAENAILRFSEAVNWDTHDWGEGNVTFEIVEGATYGGGMEDAEELQKAIRCFEADINVSVEPFTSYRKFVWAGKPFARVSCGAFAYEKKDGGIVYHECNDWIK